MALVRLVVVGFIVLTVVYVCLSLYSRSVRREKLEREFDEEIREGDRDGFVREGLRDYDQSLRRKLILGVYVVPMLAIAATVYVVNFM
ncbi:hypothetical protein [Pseudoruegeria sp. SHC-113]|uniref:hypothetical protein n=1 Tax=Pseudoruegeria sp. SHC-113 TaxID=2855439 RepID=UPI0021BB7BCD|nr:hypothetical protein [Pseudoruegeria sp. SHC-113]MCT8159233.1 hypothetical protein [Pseudoruegeria sp. SHC-113]